MKELTNQLKWVLFALLSVLIGVYPFSYFILERQFGLLSTKSEILLADLTWNTFFYLHILLGGLALLIGWLQFNKRLRIRNPQLHRTIGKIYLIAALLSGVSAIYLAFYATGGIIASLGFALLGILWTGISVQGYFLIRRGEIARHQKWMIFSYAACWAAVTLRIWLPLLSASFGDFFIAYKIVAWLCWVPNLAVAWWIVRSLEKKSSTA